MSMLTQAASASFNNLPGLVCNPGSTYRVQKGGPQYSPAIVVYTLHSIVMVLLYYIYLLGTYHWILSLILSVHFRNWMHLNINIVNIYI